MQRASAGLGKKRRKTERKGAHRALCCQQRRPSRKVIIRCPMVTIYFDERRFCKTHVITCLSMPGHYSHLAWLTRTVLQQGHHAQVWELYPALSVTTLQSVALSACILVTSLRLHLLSASQVQPRCLLVLSQIICHSGMTTSLAQPPCFQQDGAIQMRHLCPPVSCQTIETIAPRTWDSPSRLILEEGNG